MSWADIPGTLHHSKNQPLKYLSEYSANRYSVEEVKDLFLPKKSFQRERERLFFQQTPASPSTDCGSFSKSAPLLYPLSASDCFTAHVP